LILTGGGGGGGPFFEEKIGCLERRRRKNDSAAWARGNIGQEDWGKWPTKEPARGGGCYAGRQKLLRGTDWGKLPGDFWRGGKRPGWLGLAGLGGAETEGGGKLLPFGEAACSTLNSG